MNLKECYDRFGGGYESVKERISSDAIIEKFVLKFLNEPSYEALCSALAEGRYEDGFKAAHSMKGVCANLGFMRLMESSSKITEMLRGSESRQIDEEACKKQLECVSKDYEDVINSIKASMEA